MAAEIPTPVCEATGLPLPILPTEPDQRAPLLFSDYHHHFHPRRDPALAQLDGNAVRFSRGQHIYRYLHDRYHDIFTGPPLPLTAEAKFRTAVMACAGVVPRQAIDLSKHGEYTIVNLSDGQFEQISAPHSIFIEKAFGPDEYKKRRKIGKFFAAHAMQQDVKQAISDNVIDQFLDEHTTPERKKELGNFILNEALGMSLNGLASIHEELREEGYVAATKQMPLIKAARKFFTKESFPDYHKEIAKKLAA